MRLLIGPVLAACALAMLGGCVYGPGYYQRPGVVYDDEAAVGYESGYSYAPGYAYSPYGYGWYGGYGYGGYGGPWLGLGFSGTYYHGRDHGHHHRDSGTPGTHSAGHRHGH